MDPSMETQFGPFSDCAAGHLAVKPRKGAVLLTLVYCCGSMLLRCAYLLLILALAAGTFPCTQIGSFKWTCKHGPVVMKVLVES